MAFTFIVEDGTVVPNANTYLSVEEADALVAVNIHAFKTWDLLPCETKERLLSWASRYLDSTVQYYGTRVSSSSGLRWPREGVCDRDGIELDPTAIPSQLKYATAYMASYLMKKDRSVEQQQEGITKIKSDVIELEFEEGYRLSAVPDFMHQLLEGLGRIQSGSRIRFARIIK